MNARMRYIQLALEASIPLLGIFVWNWSLYFILLFYFIDLFSGEMIVHLKARRILGYQNQAQIRKEWIRYGLLSTGLLALTLVLIHLAMLLIQPGIVFIDEVIAFWQYEEMGIQQGYLFVPLVFLVSYQQYRIEFLMPARYRTQQMRNTWFTHLRALILLAIAAALAIGVSWLVQLPELVYVLAIVAGCSAYALWSERQR